MKRQGTKHHMDGLLMLLLFGVFAVCVLAVLMTGARAYRGLTSRDQAAYDRRTCVQYIATRVRQSDVWGGVSLDELGGSPALLLHNGMDDCVTRIYCHDGWLMELYTFENAQLNPEDGERIMPMEALDFTLEDGLLTARMRGGEGTEDALCLSLRCGEEAAG